MGERERDFKSVILCAILSVHVYSITFSLRFDCCILKEAVPLSVTKTCHACFFVH